MRREGFAVHHMRPEQPLPKYEVYLTSRDHSCGSDFLLTIVLYCVLLVFSFKQFIIYHLLNLLFYGVVDHVQVVSIIVTWKSIDCMGC